MDFFEQSINNYSGLSTETKPTIAAGNKVPNGSRWREVDTGETYFFNTADDTWYDVISFGLTDTELRATPVPVSVSGVATELKQDDIITNQTDGSQATKIYTNSSESSVQNPLPTDGDSVYVKDVDLTFCDNGDFTGIISDYFDSLKTVSLNTTATNPKIIKVWFKRSVQMHAIGFGCDNLSYSFSNIVFKALGSGEEVRYTEDQSSDGTKRNSYLIKNLPPLALNGFTIEFHTADTIGLSNLIVFKSIDVTARIQALKPDGTVVDISATNSGNLKMSLEEFESDVSSNSNTQLNVTQFSSNGNEGTQLQDETGTPFGIKQIDNKPRISAMDYLYDIAEGNIPDHHSINKFGHNNTVGTTWETIWTGSSVYPYMTVADQLEVLSDDANDDDADTGAWTVTLYGLDANWDEISETVTMNGTAAVTTNASFRRIFRAKVITAGTSGVNEGTIIIRDQDIGTTRAEIIPTMGQTLMATWTVPHGYTFYGTSWYAGSAVTKAIDIGIFIRDNSISNASWQNKKFMSFSDTTFKLNEELPVMIPSKSDIEIRAKATVGGAEISAGFNGWYEVI